jgi:hypothetical protein
VTSSPLSTAKTPFRYVRTVADDCGCEVLYALKAISLYPEAAELAELIGAELFEAGAPRAVAALLRGNPAPFKGLKQSERDRATQLLEVVDRCNVPGGPAGGLHCVRLVAERRGSPIVAASLRWGAGQIEADRPHGWVKKKIDEAFALAGHFAEGCNVALS